MSKLTHLDESGNAHMVDVGGKESTRREAIARGRVVMAPATLQAIMEQGVKKGDVLATARIAGIMAAKRTADLIPLCHPLGLDVVEVGFKLDEAASQVHIQARACTHGPTGVEMEAMTAVSVAALTLYDMCKAMDRGMTIEGIHLWRKSGGKSGTWQA